MKIQNRDDVALQGLPHSNAKYSSICSSLQSNANCIVHSMVGGYFRIMFGRYLIIAAVLIVLLGVLWNQINRRRTPLPSLSEWFSVAFSETAVTMSAKPPGKAPWEQSFLWSEVTRICFMSEGLLASDAVYVFTSQRPESFVIPIEAKGGMEFWSRVLSLDLFPSDLATKATSLPEGASLCWPPVDGK
jgi:hypothetical protein